MNKNKTLAVFRNMIKTKVYIYVLVIVTLCAITIPSVMKYKFIPEYKNLILNNILDEAQKVAKHLSQKTNYQNTNITQIDNEIKQELEVFNILKARYFDNKGLLIYSSKKEEIGSINKNLYFFEEVAKGKVVYKIEHKDNKSFEDEILPNNVIEIYIPNMKENKFISAFELYYGIDDELNTFDILAKNTMLIIYLATFFGYILFFIIILNASRNNLNLKIKQSQLKKMAHRDSLTNLHNRRYFYDIAKKVLSIASRNDEKLSLAMLDIDDFKMINDTYGHNVGDFVIKSLAAKLREVTRDSDIIARFGGEEFIILLPKTRIEGANKLAKKICESISSQELKYNEIELSFTVSIGISEFKKEQNIDDFIHESDKALYLAKGSGKNRVEKL